MKKNILHIILLFSLFITSSCAIKEDFNTITKKKSSGMLVFEKPSSKNNINRKYPRDNKKYLNNNDLNLVVSDKKSNNQDMPQNHTQTSQETSKKTGFFSKLFSNSKKKDQAIEPEIKKTPKMILAKKTIDEDAEEKNEARIHHAKHQSHKKSSGSFPKLDKIPAVPEHFKDSEKLKNTLKNDLNDLHNELSKNEQTIPKSNPIVSTQSITPIAKTPPVELQAPEASKKEQTNNLVTTPQTAKTNDNKTLDMNKTPVQLPPPPAVTYPKNTNDINNAKSSFPSSTTPTNDMSYEQIKFQDNSNDPLTIPNIDKSVTDKPAVDAIIQTTKPSPKPVIDNKPPPPPSLPSNSSPSLPSLPSLPPLSLKELDPIHVEVVPMSRQKSFYIPKRYKNNDSTND